MHNPETADREGLEECARAFDIPYEGVPDEELREAIRLALQDQERMTDGQNS